MTTTTTAPAGTVPTGVRCGNHGKAVVHHGDVAAVRACFMGVNKPGYAERLQQEIEIVTSGHFGQDMIQVTSELGDGPQTPGLRASLHAPTDDPRSSISAKAALIPVSDQDGFAGYATLAADGTTVELWEVERPAEGKHTGVTFVRPATKTWRDNLRGAERARVILAIAEDPKAAALLYAKSTKRCGICRRTLKRPESVERGMGPVCASKFE